MIWIAVVLVYLIIAWFAYDKFISKWNHPTWEKIMISLSWICVLPLYGIRKIQEKFFMNK